MAVQTEELQEKENEIQRLEQHIAGVYQVAESTVEFEVAQALARERLPPIPVMAKAIAEGATTLSLTPRPLTEVNRRQTSDETHPEVCSAEELEQIVGSKTEPREGLKSEALDAMDKLVDDFGDVADRYDLSDMEQRQMAGYRNRSASLVADKLTSRRGRVVWWRGALGCGFRLHREAVCE